MVLDKTDEWMKKRKNTVAVYLTQTCLNGIERLIVDSTLWLYILTEFNESNKKLVYGLTTVSYQLNTILFSVPLARYVDKTRNAKIALLVSNFLTLIGNLMYMLPYSIYLLIFGRFLCGCAVTVRPVMIAEISRSYPSTEVDGVIIYLTIFQFIGKGLGAVIPIPFSNMDIWISGLHLSPANACVFVVIFLGIAQTIFILCSHQDLSKEYDLIAQMSERDTLIDNCEPTASWSEVTKQLFRNIDTVLIMVLTFFLDFFYALCIHIYPVVIISVLHYNIKFVNGFNIAYITFTVLITISLKKIRVRGKSIYYIGLASLLGIGFIVTCFKLFSRDASFSMNVSLIVLLCISYSISWLGEKIFLVATMTKLLHTENKSIGEGWRGVVRYIGGMLGSFSSLYVYSCYNYLFFVLLFIVLLLYVLTTLRGRSLKDPQPVV